MHFICILDKRTPDCYSNSLEPPLTSVAFFDNIFLYHANDNICISKGAKTNMMTKRNVTKILYFK